MIKRRNKQSITYGQAFELFINAKKIKSVSESTIENYIQSYEYFISSQNLSSSKILDDSVKDLVDNYILILKDKNMSVPSINHFLGDIRVFLYWCMNENYIDKFKISLLKGQESKIKFFSDEELKILLIKPKDKSDFVECRTYAIICFILATGARASTICDIKLEDIDFVNKEVTYRHLKNKQSAVIPLSNSLIKVLNDYIKEWDNHSDYLFCDISEGKLSRNALSLGLKRYCIERGIKPRGPHSLRHNFARGWIKNNGNAFSLQQMLTHSDISMTRKYVKLFSNDLHNNLENFSPLDTIKCCSSRTKTIKKRIIDN